MSIPDFGHL